MKISTQSAISDFQTKFNGKFPGLRIAFYDQAHATKEGSASTSQYDTNIVLKDIMKNKLGEINFTLNPEQPVGEFEQMMERDFGLHIQVFRRSNALWLQTSKSDDWSLEKQNLKGLHSVQT